MGALSEGSCNNMIHKQIAHASFGANSKFEVSNGISCLCTAPSEMCNVNHVNRILTEHAEDHQIDTTTKGDVIKDITITVDDGNSVNGKYHTVSSRFSNNIFINLDVLV